MTEQRDKPDLSSIEPIRPAAGEGDAMTGQDATNATYGTDAPADRGGAVSRGVAEPSGGPSVVVDAAPIADEDDGDEAGARGLDR